MKIAIDVMGGDNSPSADLDAVFGYIEDPSNKSVDFFLVGNESMILQYLTDNNKSSKYIKIINAEEHLLWHQMKKGNYKNCKNIRNYFNDKIIIINKMNNVVKKYAGKLPNINT